MMTKLYKLTGRRGIRGTGAAMAQPLLFEAGPWGPAWTAPGPSTS